MINVKISIPSEAVFHIGGFAVTNSMLASFIVSIVLIAALVGTARAAMLKPAKGFKFIIETLVDVIIDQMTTVLGSREKALKFFPLIATFFFFILFNNLSGLIPGLNLITIGGEEGPVPLFRRTTSDLNTTFALALVSFVTTAAYGYRALGIKGSLQRYFHGPVAMWPIGLMELLLEFTRVISFSFRLFGNMFAGEVLLAVISALVPVIGPTPFLGFEIFVAVVQAYVFSVLTLVFISLATTPVEEH